MPTVSRGPVPLDKYRVSYPIDFVKYFFGLFYLFLTFFIWMLNGMGLGTISLSALPGTQGGVKWLVGWQAGRVARWGGRWLVAYRHIKIA